jgi:hypothetical protein
MFAAALALAFGQCINGTCYAPIAQSHPISPNLAQSLPISYALPQLAQTYAVGAPTITYGPEFVVSRQIVSEPLLLEGLAGSLSPYEGYAVQDGPILLEAPRRAPRAFQAPVDRPLRVRQKVKMRFAYR